MHKNVKDKLIGMIEDGILDWETVARESIARMSMDEVDDMIHECDWDCED